MIRWPHQSDGVARVLAEIAAGARTILLTSPTGGGKSVMMQDLALSYLERMKRVVLYTNRRLLITQLGSGLDAAGIDHGVRAADHDADPDALFQLSSIQTEVSRHLADGTLFHADLVLIDEAHLQTGPKALEIITWHLGTGAVVVAVTATPIGLGHVYSRLVVAGTTSQLRQCGALVRAVHFGPDEPDMRAIRAAAQARKKIPDLLDSGDDLTEAAVRGMMGPRPKLLGRVWQWYQNLNPDRKPAILFAPGVEEAHWFAEKFTEHGVPAASISSDVCWEPKPDGGGAFTTAEKAREDIKEAFLAGRLKVLCNRFVLREGIDFRFVEHLIFATVFGSLQTYLQAGGRGLRASPATGKTRCVIQDHGGNWWRHGSLNADREWQLGYSATIYTGMRADRIRDKKEPEPGRCPRCGVILGVIRAGTVCGECGHIFTRVFRSRPVATLDGELREQTGEIFTRRAVKSYPTTAKNWAGVYWRCRKAKRPLTFKQAMGLFVHEYHYEPPRTLKWMPLDPVDWYRLIREVPANRLIGYEPKQEDLQR